ncbi:MAG TPA: hypothetical protein VM695_10180 [Phycisphaerae bacterium]|nr:hypothetical protein [Phycisphaerae bacterium]
MKTLLLLLLAASAFGGEVVKDDQGRLLIPMTKLLCAPLYEIKDAKMTLCRVGNSQDPAIVVTLTFIHRNSGEVDVYCVCDFGSSGAFREAKLQAFAKDVKPLTLTTVRFIANRPIVKLGDRAIESVKFTPCFSFSHSR